MGKIVTLSGKTQTLIEQYIKQGCPETSAVRSFSSKVDADTLVTWLSREEANHSANVSKKSQQALEFILTSVRVGLLSDLLVFMGVESEELRKEDKTPSKTTHFKFYLLAASGALVAACESFDNITTLLSVFSLPSIAILLMGMAFSVLSVAVFTGFNLAQVSKNLGVKFSDAPKLLDLYVMQMKEIKSLRKKIDNYKLATLSTEELEHLIKLTMMLHTRFDSLANTCKQFDASLKSRKVNIAKTIFGALSGILFFGSGFCAGQSSAVFLLGLVIAGGVSTTCVPVVLFSVAVGLAAFCLYWYVEKVGFQQLISTWFGLNEEQIEELCDQEKLDEQSQKLCHLKEKLESTAELTRKLDALQPQGKQFDDEYTLENPPTVLPRANPEPITVSTNIYSFYQPAVVATSGLKLIEEEQQRNALG